MHRVQLCSLLKICSRPVVLRCAKKSFKFQAPSGVCYAKSSTAQRRSYVSTPAEESTELTSTDELDRLAAERALQAAFAHCPTAQSICLLGIDPDASGAVAVMHWDVAAGPEALKLEDATLQVYDMPLESVPVGKRLRKQADPAAIIHLLNSIHVPPAAEIKAVLEQPVPNRLNGNFSWFSAGYNYGVWKSILISRGIGFRTVSARAWKFDLMLNKLGKEGSRQLAQQILPQSAQQLKRKKDHGRAEALLIAAWGLGFRRTKPDEEAVAAEEEEAFSDNNQDIVAN